MFSYQLILQIHFEIYHPRDIRIDEHRNLLMWDLFLSFYAVAAAPAFASSAEDHTWVQTGQTLFSSSNGPLPLKLKSQANEWSYYPCTGITRFTNSSPPLLMGFSRAWWARWKCSSFKGTSHINSLFFSRNADISSFVCERNGPKWFFILGCMWNI